MHETQVQSLGQEDPLEKEMATHSRTLAWKIPWMEEPGGLSPMGPQRVRHHRVTNTHKASLVTTQPADGPHGIWKVEISKQLHIWTRFHLKGEEPSDSFCNKTSMFLTFLVSIKKPCPFGKWFQRGLGLSMAFVSGKKFWKVLPVKPYTLNFLRTPALLGRMRYLFSFFSARSKEI